jgi:hypothetical protein
MTWGAVAIGGAAVVGAVIGSKASEDAADSQSDSAAGGIAEQRAARADFNERTGAFSELGLGAGAELANLLGLNSPESTSQRGFADAQSNLDAAKKAAADYQADYDARVLGRSPTARKQIDKGMGPGLRRTQSEVEQAQRLFDEQVVIRDQLSSQPQQPSQSQQQQLEEINPIVSFLRDEGFEDIQESAAAGGRLGAGGTLRDLTQFNSDLTSTVIPQLQNQKFNQLFNVLGLGANAATGQGTAGLQTASNIGNLLGAQGAAQASGAFGRANAITGAINNVAGAAGAFGGQSGNQSGGQTGGSGAQFNSNGSGFGNNFLGQQNNNSGLQTEFGAQF